jgi:hypothetical protein
VYDGDGDGKLDGDCGAGREATAALEQRGRRLTDMAARSRELEQSVDEFNGMAEALQRKQEKRGWF